MTRDQSPETKDNPVQGVDQPAPSPSGGLGGSRLLVAGLWSLVSIAAAIYAWSIYKHASPFAAGSDSSGYLNSARLLASGQFTVTPREVPGYPPPWRYYSHMPLGFTMDEGATRMAPTYPIGLPLHLAALAPIVGWEKTARVVNALNVLAAGALLYALGRRFGLAPLWALTAVAALWLSPVWTLFSLQPMSDPLAATWSLAALLWAWQSQQRWPWSIAAGAALGVAVLVRPANLILAVPLLVALRPDWRAWVGCAAGGAPFAAVMMFYNQRTYGAVLTTGYGFVGDAFAWENVPHNLGHFARWVPLLVGVPVALASLALLSRRTAPGDVSGRVRAVLITWAGIFAAFYASYFFAGETWWYLRFLLPAFAAVILSGLLVLSRLAARSRRAGYVVAALVVASLASQRVIGTELIHWSVRDGERRYYRVCQWLNEHLPADAIVASCQLSGAQYYYTPFALLRWDQLPRDEMEKVMAGLRSAHRPLYAVIFKFEESRAMTDHLPGQWAKLHEIEGDVAIWQWRP